MLTLLASIRGILLIVTYLKYLFEIQIIRLAASQHVPLPPGRCPGQQGGGGGDQARVVNEISRKFSQYSEKAPNATSISI